MKVENPDAGTVVYTGGLIHGLTVSELIGALFIVDSTNKKITSYEYDPAVLQVQKQTAPYLKDVIQKTAHANDVYGVSIYKEKQLVWGNHANG